MRKGAEEGRPVIKQRRSTRQDGGRLGMKRRLRGICALREGAFSCRREAHFPMFSIDQDWEGRVVLRLCGAWMHGAFLRMAARDRSLASCLCGSVGLFSGLLWRRARTQGENGHKRTKSRAKEKQTFVLSCCLFVLLACLFLLSFSQFPFVSLGVW